MLTLFRSNRAFARHSSLFGLMLLRERLLAPNSETKCATDRSHF